jgi:hypothetical protein
MTDDTRNCDDVAEKKYTAKIILCFMYLLNKDHIQAHLPIDYNEIKKWCSNFNELNSLDK